MDGGCSHIRVCVRIRPENEAEKASALCPAVVAMDETVLVFDPPPEQQERFFHGKVIPNRDPTSRKAKDLKFAFDRVFSPTTTNIDVYEHTTKNVLRSLLDGYNCSVFAYGATGAGKTFSMLGSAQTPGVIFLTMMDLYNMKEAQKDEKHVDIAVSYLEVYNEMVKDLLDPTNGCLPLREDAGKGVIIQGLSTREPQSAEELLQMLEKGNKNRTQHPTDANAESSRSHAVFQVFVKLSRRTADIKGNVKVAKMSLIDLAGSERATVTRNNGARFREGANINRSLLALGNCINALADTKKKGTKHIPYRNSKLTRILKDSLGGNCSTVMIAAVSPSRLTYEDTYNTLKYADRAKKIKADLRKNVFSMDLHVSNYIKVIDELHLEISELKEKVRLEAEKTQLLSVVPVASTCSFNIAHLQQSFITLCDDRSRVRDDILHIESMKRQVNFTVFRKQKVLERLDILSSARQAGVKTTNRITRAIEAAISRENNLEKAKISELENLSENTRQLQQWYRSSLDQPNQHAQQILALQLQCKNFEMALNEVSKQVKHSEKIAKLLQADCSNSDRLVLLQLQFMTEQHEKLQQFGLNTQDLSDKFQRIKEVIINDRHVTFNGTKVIAMETETPSFESFIDLPTLTAAQHQAQITGVEETVKTLDSTFTAGCTEDTFVLSNTPRLSYAEAAARQPSASPVAPNNLRSPASRSPSSPACQSLHSNRSTFHSSDHRESPSPTNDFCKPTSPCSVDINEAERVDVFSQKLQQGTSALRKRHLDIFPPVHEVLQEIRASKPANVETGEPTPAKLRILDCTQTLTTPSVTKALDLQIQSDSPLAYQLPSTPTGDATFIIPTVSRVPSQSGEEPCESSAYIADSACSEQPMSESTDSNVTRCQPSFTVLSLAAPAIVPTVFFSTPPLSRTPQKPMNFAEAVKSPALQPIDTNRVKTATVTKTPAYQKMTHAASQKRLNLSKLQGPENT